MKLWVTRQADGRFTLTWNKPVIKRIMGTRIMGVYAEYGDSVFIRDQCAVMMNEVVKDFDVTTMKLLESRQFTFSAELIKD